MSHRIEITNSKTGTKDVIPVIAVEKSDEGTCEECGAGPNEDLRPYGAKGARICYDCGKKNEARTQHNMGIQLFGNPGELQ